MIGLATGKLSRHTCMGNRDREKQQLNLVSGLIDCEIVDLDCTGARLLSSSH